MQGQGANLNQPHFFSPNLLEQLNPRQPLLQLAQQIPWDYFEKEFSVYTPLEVDHQNRFV